MATVRDLIQDSLRLIRAIDANESIEAAEAMDAMSALNDMLDDWSIQNFLVLSKTTEKFTLTPNQQSYTMGVGGNFNTSRPVDIEYASLELQNSDPKVETPIALLTSKQWSEIEVKELASDIPDRLFANPTYPLLTINLYPKPSAAHKLCLTTLKPLTAFTNLSNELSLAPGYKNLIKYNLAKRLCSEYGQSMTAEDEQTRIELIENVKRKNFQPAYLKTDPALTVGNQRFNIYKGD